MHHTLATAAAVDSFMSFGLEFGGAIEAIGGVDGSIGVMIGIPNTQQAGISLTVGLSAGGEAGGDVDVALSLNKGAPAETGGPFFAPMIEGDEDIGAGGAISFNLPDFSFGGISVNGSVGAEIKLADGLGYTHIF